MGTSTIGSVEPCRQLDPGRQLPHCECEACCDGFTEISLVTDEIGDGAAEPAGGVRTLDAVHIASAQAIGDALAFLVSYDKRMLDVAHSAGIPIAAPGMSR